MLYNSFRLNTTGLIERLYRVYKIRRNTKIEYLFKTTPFFLDSRPGKEKTCYNGCLLSRYIVWKSISPGLYLYLELFQVFERKQVQLKKVVSAICAKKKVSTLKGCKFSKKKKRKSPTKLFHFVISDKFTMYNTY